MQHIPRRGGHTHTHTLTRGGLLKGPMWISYYSYTMSQKDSRRQPITSSLQRWYFSPTAKLGQPQTSLASPGVEKHPSLHTQTHRLTHTHTHTAGNSFLPVTGGGGLGQQRRLWWMASVQVMCGVKREAAPRQEHAAARGPYWSMDGLSVTPTSRQTPKRLSPTYQPATSSIQNSQQSGQGEATGTSTVWMPHLLYVRSQRWEPSERRGKKVWFLSLFGASI